MRIKAIPLLIVLMLLALVGIIVIQYKWIRKSIDEKQALVDNKVIQAVTNVDIQLSDLHALSFFSDANQFNFEIADSLFVLHHFDSLVPQPFPFHPDQQNVELRVVSGLNE